LIGAREIRQNSDVPNDRELEVAIWIAEFPLCQMMHPATAALRFSGLSRTFLLVTASTLHLNISFFIYLAVRFPFSVPTSSFSELWVVFCWPILKHPLVLRNVMPGNRHVESAVYKKRDVIRRA
jgi:hypothetical protein